MERTLGAGAQRRGGSSSPPLLLELCYNNNHIFSAEVSAKVSFLWTETVTLTSNNPRQRGEEGKGQREKGGETERKEKEECASGLGYNGTSDVIVTMVIVMVAMKEK